MGLHRRVRRHEARQGPAGGGEQAGAEGEEEGEEKEVEGDGDDGEVRVMTEEEVQNEQIREWVLDHVDD